MEVSLAGGHLQRARDDRAEPLRRCAQRLQLLPLEPELGAQVAGAGWSRGGEMIQQPGPAAVGSAHALDLRAADRVEQARHLAGHEQVLAAVDRGDQVAAPGELAEPWPFRRWPRGETPAGGLVRSLVARLIQARQRTVRRARQQPAVAQERIRLLK